VARVSQFVSKPFVSLLATVTLLLAPVAGFAQARGTVVLSPSVIHFGDIISGQTKDVSCTLTNNGKATVITSRATPSNGVFSVTQLSAPRVLGAGASITFKVHFAPQALKHWDASIVVTSNASDPSPSLFVHGNGVPAGTLAVAPATLNFGGVHVGSRESLPVSVKNIGFSNVQITQETISGNGFHLSGLRLPLTRARE
jgi:hypothetical protein